MKKALRVFCNYQEWERNREGSGLPTLAAEEVNRLQTILFWYCIAGQAYVDLREVDVITGEGKEKSRIWLVPTPFLNLKVKKILEEEGFSRTF